MLCMAGNGIALLVQYVIQGMLLYNFLVYEWSVSLLKSLDFGLEILFGLMMLIIVRL